MWSGGHHSAGHVLQVTSAGQSLEDLYMGWPLQAPQRCCDISVCHCFIFGLPHGALSSMRAGSSVESTAGSHAPLAHSRYSGVYCVSEFRSAPQRTPDKARLDSNPGHHVLLSTVEAVTLAGSA